MYISSCQSDIYLYDMSHAPSRKFCILVQLCILACIHSSSKQITLAIICHKESSKFCRTPCGIHTKVHGSVSYKSSLQTQIAMRPISLGCVTDISIHLLPHGKCQQFPFMSKIADILHPLLYTLPWYQYYDCLLALFSTNTHLHGFFFPIYPNNIGSCHTHITQNISCVFPDPWWQSNPMESG